MELLDIVDEKGNPTGETVPREVAHREGIRHRTAHVWIFRRRGGVVQILLQKRKKCLRSGGWTSRIAYLLSGRTEFPTAFTWKNWNF